MATPTHQLIIWQNGAVVQQVLLGDATMTIGREPENSLPLPNPMVSRRHADVRLVPEGLVLTDLDSSNGTFVNGAKLLAHQPVVLPPGSTFEIAPFTITYQLVPVADAPQEIQAVSPPPETRAAPPTPARAKPVDVAPVEPPLPPAPPLPPRPTSVMPMASGPLSPYLRDLPIIFQDNDFLGRFMLIFETIWEPLEHRQDHIDMYFDPRTCSPSFLPFLAGWVGCSVDPHWPESRIRAFVANAYELYSWRGTKYGLTRMIEVCTGMTPHITEPSGQPYLFHISVRVPPESEVDRDLLEQLIIQHKPAHVGYVLDVQG